jgi:hypothetical protein
MQFKDEFLIAIHSTRLGLRRNSLTMIPNSDRRITRTLAEDIITAHSQIRREHSALMRECIPL